MQSINKMNERWEIEHCEHPRMTRDITL